MKVTSYYDPDGDLLEILWDNDSYYGEPHGTTTILVGRSANVPVGITTHLASILRNAGCEIVPLGTVQRLQEEIERLKK